MKKHFWIFLAICIMTTLALTISALGQTVYVSDSGSGDGSSVSSPTASLTNAYTMLGSDGGEIVIVGTVTVPLNKGDTSRTAFVEPAHSGKITVSGYNSNAKLLFASPYEYHMSGETEIKNLIISSGAYTSGISICARGHHLTMGDGLTMHSTGTVSGTTQVGTKVYLHGGCIPNATYAGYLDCDNHLTVKSGTYWGIIGFNRNVNVATTGRSLIEVGGDVNTHYLIAGSTGTSSFVSPASSEIYIIGDLNVTQQISLGNQNSDVTSFDSNLILLDGKLDFTENFIDYTARKRMTTLDIYYDAASNSAKTSYETYFKGYGDREGTLVSYCVNELGGHTFVNGSCSRCGTSEIVEDIDTVYVSDGGSGDGSSVSSPTASLTNAYTMLGSDGGEIVIVGTVTVPLNKGGTSRTAFVEPAHSGKITVSGYNSNAKLLFASPYEYHMSGETEFKDLIISSGTYTSGISICARGHHLTMGDGLTMHSTGTVSGTTQVGTKVYLHGGCIPNATYAGYLDCDNHLTVKSGTYWGIIGFNRNVNVATTGRSLIEVGGDVSTHYLISGSSGTSDFTGKAGTTIRIIGDLRITQQLSLGNQNTRPEAFSTTLIIEDGTVEMLGSLIDYTSRTHIRDLSVYVNTSSEEAFLTYNRLFAGYGDREGTIADYCVNELGGHKLTDGICSECGYTDVCDTHNFTRSTNGTVTTMVCDDCALTVKTTSKTDSTVGVYTRIIDDIRVQVLDNGIIRFEEKYSMPFTDEATLVVPDRTAFKGTSVIADEDSETVILSVNELTVNIPKNGKIADIRIFDADGNVFYDYYSAPKAAMFSSLPDPGYTPDVYAIIDNGILPAEGGLTYTGSTDDTSDWERTDNTDIYVLCPFGDAELLRKQVITVTGPTMMSSVKTLGAWYSKWTSYSGQQRLALIEEFRTRGIPLDIIIIDTEWKATSANGNDGDGTGYDTNDELYPDMPDFLKKAEEAGVYVLFNDHTHSTSYLITDPLELEWQSNGIISLMNQGLDGWWYDRNWSYTIKSPYIDVPYTTIGQVLYYDTMQKFHSETDNRRVLMLSNVDWIRHGHITGSPSIISHRYGTQWTGDIYWDPAQLKREISNMVLGGVNGASPYMSSDLGGFWDNDWVSENHFIRWMQYGAFSPVYRPHSSLSSTNEHLPWSYGEDSCAIVTDFINMRYHLIPYYYMLARENYETGMPLARRLDFYYPQYEEAKDNSQYLIGKDILVAPYYGTSGDGHDVVPTEWLTAADGSRGLNASYFKTDSSTNRENYFSGTPAVTKVVPTIDFYWYTPANGMSGAPATNMSDDYFAAEFSGKITPAYDCYIGILADDCARIYIDGELWVNWKSGQMAQNFNTTSSLKAGVTYDIVVQYYEGTGKAVAYLMCEPVLPENTSSRSVFIPDGTWINVFTGEETVGPKTITVTGDTSTMPVFVRKGAAIPVSEVISPMTGADFENLSVNIYGLSDTSFTLYEDDGESEKYLDGDYRKTDISISNVKNGKWQVDISAASGKFATDYTSRKVKLRIHSNFPLSAKTADGEELAVTSIQRADSALPFANSGASTVSHVYEIEIDAALANETSVIISTNLLGDVDGNGRVTVHDAIKALLSQVNKQSCPEGDVDMDGTVTLLDVIKILKLIVEE